MRILLLSASGPCMALAALIYTRITTPRPRRMTVEEWNVRAHLANEAHAVLARPEGADAMMAFAQMYARHLDTTAAVAPATESDWPTVIPGEVLR